MGKLTVGTPLNWTETKHHAEMVRRRGVYQLMKLFQKYQIRQHDPLLWGDEIEYLVISYHHHAQLSTRASNILNDLNQEQDEMTNWAPEYGRYMLEGTPGVPYSSEIEGLLQVETNMKYRRQQVKKHLQPHEKLITLPSYPRFGCEGFLDFPSEETLRFTLSKSIPDNISNPHPRYHYICQNIISRRVKPLDINIPVFQDEITDIKEVQFDSVGAGSGCCCLQVTFQAPDVNEARFLYDRLLPLAPIFQALSNNTSVMGGMLSNFDNRWSVLEQAFDDRSPGELGQQPLQPGEQLMEKSRYGSASLYISKDSDFNSIYNDLNTPVHQNTFVQLQSAGMDSILATHFSHIFQRDPLLLFNEQTHSESSLDGSDFFENFQSTVWQSVRFKPPPNDDIGWRVEFRPLEVQLTDFENAAFAIAINLLVRAIFKFRPNFYIPISKVDLNMKFARKRDAVNQGQFFFRSDIFGTGSIKSKPQLMSVDTIINGDNQFIGILPLITAYLEISKVDTKVLKKLLPYLNLIHNRANGNALTGAQYVRQFVQSHPDYRKDSHVSSTINDDLIKHISALQNYSTSTLFGTSSEKNKSAIFDPDSIHYSFHT